MNDVRKRIEAALLVVAVVLAGLGVWLALTGSPLMWLLFVVAIIDIAILIDRRRG